MSAVLSEGRLAKGRTSHDGDGSDCCGGRGAHGCVCVCVCVCLCVGGWVGACVCVCAGHECGEC